MAPTEAETLPPIIELSPEEWWQHFDSLANKRLGMGSREFLERLDSGEFEAIIDDPFNHPWVGYLAQMSRVVRVAQDEVQERRAMATVKPESDILPPIIELTPEESWADFDATAREHLGMTGEEFLRRLDAGEFEEIIDDPFNHRWIGYLAQLSRYARGDR